MQVDNFKEILVPVVGGLGVFAAESPGRTALLPATVQLVRHALQ